jgi:hypothetical protein
MLLTAVPKALLTVPSALLIALKAVLIGPFQTLRIRLPRSEKKPLIRLTPFEALSRTEFQPLRTLAQVGATVRFHQSRIGYPGRRRTP